MARKKHTSEEIVAKLRSAELQFGKGKATPEVCRSIGVSEHTFYRWHKECGGLRINQAKRLKTLEKENRELKKLVADLSLDKQILKETLAGNS
mgnify:FL=1